MKKIDQINSYSENEEKKVKMKGSSSYFIIVIIFLLVGFIIFAPTRTFNYEVEVFYTDSETYTEKEPYDAQEAYEVQVPYESVEYYTDTVPINRSVPYTDYEYIVYNAPSLQIYPSWDSGCSCTDSSFWRGGCIQVTCRVAQTRYKTEIAYEQIQKERPVTKYRKVTKYRTITKYSDVQKTRDIIKTKMEPREMEVNWLFGFKMPHKLHIPYIS